jgi:hypothetical protein
MPAGGAAHRACRPRNRRSGPQQPGPPLPRPSRLPARPPRPPAPVPRYHQIEKFHNIIPKRKVKPAPPPLAQPAQWPPPQPREQPRLAAAKAAPAKPPALAPAVRQPSLPRVRTPHTPGRWACLWLQASVDAAARHTAVRMTRRQRCSLEPVHAPARSPARRAARRPP